MKKVLLIHFLAISTSFAQTTADKYRLTDDSFAGLVQYLDNGFQQFAEEIPTGMTIGKTNARSFLKSFNEGRFFHQALKELSGSANLSKDAVVYIIPQTHLSNASGEWSSDGLSSQAMIRKVISDRKISLIAAESPFDISLSGFAKNNRFNSYLGSEKLKSNEELTKELDSKQDWWSAYWRNPKIRIIGFDGQEINTAGAILRFYVNSLPDGEQKNRLASLYYYLVGPFRENLAVAKIIVIMSQAGKRQAAIVMGHRHADNLASLVRFYKIKAEVLR